MSMLWIFNHNEQYTGGRHRTRAVCERRTRDLSVIVITLRRSLQFTPIHFFCHALSLQFISFIDFNFSVVID